MKALKSHASSRVLPGDDAIRSAYHNLEEVRPVETDRFEWSRFLQMPWYTWTPKSNTVEQQNTGEFISDVLIPMSSIGKSVRMESLEPKM